MNIGHLDGATIKAINSFLKKNNQEVFSPAHMKAIRGPDVLGVRNISGVYLRGDVYEFNDHTIESLDNDMEIDSVIEQGAVNFIVLKSCQQRTDILVLDKINAPIMVLEDLNLI